MVKGWDSYWKNSENKQKEAVSAIKHPLVKEFWASALNQKCHLNSTSPILEIACGDGELVNTISSNALFKGRPLFASDISFSALLSIFQRNHKVALTVANSAAMPFSNNKFGLVISRYGAEYAGIGVIDEIIRISASNSKIILLMHSTNGEIFQECNNNKSALEALQKSAFIDATEQLFKSAFAVMNGADAGVYKLAVSRFLPTKNSVEAIISQYGNDVTASFISNFMNDVLNIHDRIEHYNPEDLFSWLNTIRTQTSDYSARMDSMLNAAICPEQMSNFVSKLRAANFSIEMCDYLMNFNNRKNLGWVLQAFRQT